MWHRYFSQILQDSFAAAVAANPRLSLRGYAKQLQVSPSVLSELFRNQRKISAERALEIARMAGLAAPVMAQLEKLMSLQPEASARRVLSGEAIDLILNPDYYRLLCALEILPTPATPGAIAELLAVREESLRPAVAKLEALGVLFVENGQIYWGGRYVTTTDDVPSEKIREYHRQALRSAGDDLSLPVGEREYTSVIFAGNRARMADAKTHIRNFRDSLSDSVRDSRPDTVYQLTIQLRPVSHTFSKPQ